MLLLLQIFYRRAVKPIISERRIFVAVSLLKKRTQYLFIIVLSLSA